MGGMEERDDKRGGSGCAIGLVLAFMFLPALYVLGLAPAYWIAVKFPATNEFLRTCYTPLGIIGDAFPPFGRFLEWYMHLLV